MSTNRFEDYLTANCARRVGISATAFPGARDVPHHFALDDVSGRCRVDDGKGRCQESNCFIVDLGNLSIVFDQVLSGLIHEHDYSSAKSTCADCNTSERSKVPDKVESIASNNLILVLPLDSDALAVPRVTHLQGLATAKPVTTSPSTSPLELP